jgi:hypothetical protein
MQQSRGSKLVKAVLLGLFAFNLASAANARPGFGEGDEAINPDVASEGIDQVIETPEVEAANRAMAQRNPPVVEIKA